MKYPIREYPRLLFISIPFWIALSLVVIFLFYWSYPITHDSFVLSRAGGVFVLFGSALMNRKHLRMRMKFYKAASNEDKIDDRAYTIGLAWTFIGTALWIFGDTYIIQFLKAH